MKPKDASLISQFPELRSLTPARVRLDPSGGPIPISSVLDFQLSHAKARDAIHQKVDWDGVRSSLPGHSFMELHSRAVDRATYLRRPDLGRQLSSESIEGIKRTEPDLVIVVADGLSANAINSHAAHMINAVCEQLPELKVGPIAFVNQGRVAVGDEVAQSMGAAICLTLVGERPGLSVADSLGAYLTWNAIAGTRDNNRNCVSNIHSRGGLPYNTAAAQLSFLIRSAMKLKMTGVSLTTTLADLGIEWTSNTALDAPLTSLIK